jgi:cell division protein FtsW (lipid II flippase)
VTTVLARGGALRTGGASPRPAAGGGPARATVPVAGAWTVLAVLVGWAAVPGWTLGAAAGVAGTTAALLVALRGAPLVGGAAVVAVLGAGTTARLLDAAVDWGLLAMAAGACLVGAWVVRTLANLPARTVRLLGLVACVAAVVLRVLPLLWGRGASGAVVLGELSLRVGEFTRPLLVVGLACLLVSSSPFRPYDRGRGLPLALVTTALAVASLVVLRDLGPAALVLVAAWAVVARAVGTPASVLVPVVALPVATALLWSSVPQYARDRFGATWFSADLPSGQAGVARSLLGDVALIGPGWEGAPGLAVLPAAATDYAVLSLAATLGVAAVALVVVALLVPVVGAARRLEARADVAALVATGALVLLAGQVVVTVLGSLAWAPLTGLPFPLLSSTGSSVLPAALLVGLVAGAGRGTGRAGLDRPAVTGRLLTGATRVSVVLLVVGVVATAALAGAGGTVRNGTISLVQPRGAVLTADGHVLTPASAGAGDRVYPDGPLYLSVGWLSAEGSFGLERTADRHLTCGGERGWLAESFGSVVAAPCRPADLVTTLRHDLMVPAAGAADAAGNATVVVADATTGGILVDWTAPTRTPGEWTGRRGHRPGSIPRPRAASSS